MKNKTKTLIIDGIFFVLVVIMLLFFVIFNKNNFFGNENVVDKLVAPTNDIEEIKRIMSVIGVEKTNEDEIVFSSNVEINENEKIAVWIYSEPKFLGYFDVLVENGEKKIVGLKDALEKITIEEGKHKIVITTTSGDALGYIDVQIENNGTLSEFVNDENIDEDATKEDNKTNSVVSNNKENNTSSNETSNNKENNTSSNETSNNKENNTSSNETSNNTQKIIDSTITYSCDTMFDYKLEKDKCIRTEIIDTFYTTGTCPSGYIYKSDKYIIN